MLPARGQSRKCRRPMRPACAVLTGIANRPRARAIALSSNGKTTDSDSVNRGSNPRGASIRSIRFMPAREAGGLPLLAFAGQVAVGRPVPEPGPDIIEPEMTGACSGLAMRTLSGLCPNRVEMKAMAAWMFSRSERRVRVSVFVKELRPAFIGRRPGWLVAAQKLRESRNSGRMKQAEASR